MTPKIYNIAFFCFAGIALFKLLGLRSMKDNKTIAQEAFEIASELMDLIKERG